VQLMGGEHTELLRVCGENPGERTFATWFDIWNGVIWEIGDGFSAYLDNSIHKQIRRAQGKLSIDRLTPANGLSDKPQNLCNLIQRLWNRRKRISPHDRTSCNMFVWINLAATLPDKKHGRSRIFLV